MAFEKKMSGVSEKHIKSDVASVYVPKTISYILTEVSMAHDFSEKSARLDFHLSSLEQEMAKIDAFKRELPHCMHLLKDAIERLKEEKLQLKKKGKEPVMEELMPLKSDFKGNERVKPSNDLTEKKSWMSCVQLWSTPIQYENNFDTRNHNSFLSLKSYEEEEKEEISGFGSNLKKMGGAFVPFKKPILIVKEEKRPGTVPIEELTLSIPVAEVEDLEASDRPQQRKQRRCWSPELHKRFVDALLQLGGPLTATPKQIRELMNVDGLTNDEVKSHLQKYRLHIRKVPSTSGGIVDLNSWLAQKEHSGSPLDHSSAKRTGASMEDYDDGKSLNLWKARFLNSRV